MAELTEGNVDLLNYVDSRRHGRRFRELGAVTQPGCQAATRPDRVRALDGHVRQPDNLPGGVRAAGRHRRPAAVPQSRTSIPRTGTPRSTAQHPKGMQPPYLIGMACGFCHVGFNPLNPPAESRATEVERTGRRHRQPVLGGGAPLQPEDDRRRTSAGTSATGSRRARPTRRASRPTTSTTRATSTPSSCSPIGPRPWRRCPTAPSEPCLTSSRTAPTRLAWPARRCACTSTSACARRSG